MNVSWPTHGILATLLILLLSPSAIAQVRVRGYYRKDGTYVRPHFRSYPTRSFYHWPALDGLGDGDTRSRGNPFFSYHDHPRRKRLERFRAKTMLQRAAKDRSKGDYRACEQWLRRIVQRYPATDAARQAGHWLASEGDIALQSKESESTGLGPRKSVVGRPSQGQP